MNLARFLRWTAGNLSLLGNLLVMSACGVLILIGVSLIDLSSGLLDLQQPLAVAIIFALVVDVLMVSHKLTQARAKWLIRNNVGDIAEHKAQARRSGWVVLVTALISSYMNAKEFSSNLVIPPDVARLTEIPFTGVAFKDIPFAGDQFAVGIPLFMPLLYAILMGVAVTVLIYQGAKVCEYFMYPRTEAKSSASTRSRTSTRKPRGAATKKKTTTSTRKPRARTA